MNDQAMLGLRIVFWALAFCIGVLPMRWALFGFILISHIDITSSSFDSATSFGLENGIKTVLLPAILLIRSRGFRISPFRGNHLLTLWAAFTAYAAIACVWTPFQISGIKMTGYLFGYAVLAVVFLDGWNRGRLTPLWVAATLWISLCMALLQTYVLGNRYGKSLPGLHDDRFTSFCSPQFFGAFLLAALSILLVTSRQRWWVACLNGLAGFAGIVLCGSRYVFLGALALLGIVWLSHVARQRTVRGRMRHILSGMLGFAGAVLIFGLLLYADPGNRISRFSTMVLQGESPFDNIGTFVWRRGIYEQAWNLLSERGPVELTFGSGTSSGASVVLGWDRRYQDDRIDANRVIHNELLRVLVEWGLVGLLLFSAILVQLIRLFTKAAVRNRIIPAYAFLALLPMVILGCLSENILAASASPAGVGILLSMMYGLSYYTRTPATAKAGPIPQLRFDVSSPALRGF